MKVLHIYKSYYPETLGGVEKLISTLSSGLLKYGIYSDVLTTSSSNKAYLIEKNHQKIFFYPQTLNKFSCPISIELLSNFKHLAKKYDLLHFHYPWPFADFVHLLHKTGIPTILTYHSDIVRQRFLKKLYSPLAYLFLKKIGKIIPTSPNLLNSSQTLAAFKKKCVSIPIGLDPITIGPEHTTVSEALLQYYSRPFFLFVGVLRYYKGLDYLLEAAKGLQCEIVIAGTGPEENHLKQKCKALSLDNVHFTGKIDEITKEVLIKNCHALVAPAHLRTEAFCISLLEALMQGKPLISTELGTGTSFVNLNDQTGIVVAPADSNALRKAMQTLLNKPELYAKYAQNCINHYKTHFTLSKMLDSYKKEYFSI